VSAHAAIHPAGKVVIRRIKFIEQIAKVHSQHTALFKIYQHLGKKELDWLRSML